MSARSLSESILEAFKAAYASKRFDVAEHLLRALEAEAQRLKSEDVLEDAYVWLAQAKPGRPVSGFRARDSYLPASLTWSMRPQERHPCDVFAQPAPPRAVRFVNYLL